MSGDRLGRLLGAAIVLAIIALLILGVVAAGRAVL